LSIIQTAIDLFVPRQNGITQAQALSAVLAEINCQKAPFMEKSIKQINMIQSSKNSILFVLITGGKKSDVFISRQKVILLSQTIEKIFIDM